MVLTKLVIHICNSEYQIWESIFFCIIVLTWEKLAKISNDKKRDQGMKLPLYLHFKVLSISMYSAQYTIVQVVIVSIYYYCELRLF